ncbi:hypothetical protein CPB84DRAFT_1766540 [Gymnopilus junonius]|uniref:Uncharacterized protein n=1 Tax=Gymnopilus junonius TaxID=109634 RepID=A0A9P5NWC7_GYMJU|nr:hypothetical protein CPB84DRAFT_1766540 [Gymnopilus junonius]
MASTPRPASPILYPSRELMQELDDVKNLLQMTLDETKAWCNDNKYSATVEGVQAQTVSTHDQMEDFQRESEEIERQEAK